MPRTKLIEKLLNVSKYSPEKRFELISPADAIENLMTKQYGFNQFTSFAY